MNLKIIKIFFLVLFPFLCLAQSETENTTGKSQKLFIGFNFSTDICYRSLYTQATDPFIAGLIPSRRKDENAKVAYSLGVNFEYQIKKAFSVSSGIQYANKGYKMDWIPLITINSDSVGRAKSTENFHYLDIPLGLNLKLGKKKFQFLASTGIILNVLIKVKNKIRVESPNRNGTLRIKNNYDWNTLNLSYYVSFGTQYTFNNKSFVRIEPILRYNLLSILDAPIKGRLFSAGVNLSYYLPLTKKH